MNEHENYFKGRGAQLNPNNKFLDKRYTRDYIEGLDEEFLENSSTQFYEENPTSVQNRSDNSEIPKGDNLNEILEKVESSRDYFVIPRAVLKENYRLVALEQFQIEKEKLENERDEMKRRAEKDRVYLEAQLEANRDLSRKLDVLLAKFAEVQKSQ